MNIRTADIRLGAGLLILPAILLQESVAMQCIQVCYAIGLAVRHNRRFKLLPNLLLLVSVTVLNVFQPNGLHLFDLGSFPITAGALLLGARKALALIGLLYVSQYMVSGKPHFPGTLGRLLSLQFMYFDQIARRWSSVDKRHPIHAIDVLLLSFDTEKPEVDLVRDRTDNSKHLFRHILLNVLHCMVFWILFALGASGFLDFLTAYAY